MDEATANIDIKTEEIIQTAISTFFKDTTIITIAHRIKTIINYDKIMVLKDGHLIEFDSPQKLIEKTDSLFYELYSKSGL